MKRSLLCIFLAAILLAGCTSSNQENVEQTATPLIEETQIVEQEQVLSFNEAKTYDQDVTYKDDMEVTKDGVIIENATFENNLTITSDVGDGDVTLSNVEIKGDLIINGGGLNSVELINATANNIIINRIDAPVRVFLNLNSKANNIDVLNNSMLEIEGTVDTLNIYEDADTTSVTMLSNSHIKTLNTESNISLFGEGLITLLQSRTELSLPSIKVENLSVITDLFILSSHDEASIPTQIPEVSVKPTSTTKPTIVPSAKPTTIPAPTTTPWPTSVPTVAPTAAPTAAPTPVPTAAPTSVPKTMADEIDVFVTHELVPFVGDKTIIHLPSDESWDNVYRVWLYAPGDEENRQGQYNPHDLNEPLDNGKYTAFTKYNPDGTYIIQMEYHDGSTEECQFTKVTTDMYDRYVPVVTESGDLLLEFKDTSNIDLNNLVFEFPSIEVLSVETGKIHITSDEMIVSDNSLTIPNEVLINNNIYSTSYYYYELFTTDGRLIDTNYGAELYMHSVNPYPVVLSDINFEQSTGLLHYSLEHVYPPSTYQIYDDSGMIWETTFVAQSEFVTYEEVVGAKKHYNYSINTQAIKDTGVSFENNKEYTVKLYNYKNMYTVITEVTFTYLDAS